MSLLDKIIDYIFDKIRASQERRAMKALKKDPEYQKAKQELDKAVKDAQDFISKMKSKYDLKL